MNKFKILNILFIIFLISFFFIYDNFKNLPKQTNEIINSYKNDMYQKQYYLIKDDQKVYFSDIYELNTDKLDIKINNEQNPPRGIYVDFIYNPNYNIELTIVQYILIEILNKTKINFFYDFENLSNSTVITTGYEDGYVLSKKHLITIKPKLLKDVVYNENIFSRIYILIYNYFRMGLEYDNIPEYDRTINYVKYKKLFYNKLQQLDRVNFNNLICRNELKYKYQNKLCILVNENYIDKIFKDEKLSFFYKTFLKRIAWVVELILFETTSLKYSPNKDDCYKIYIYPEVDINKVLLLPHAAVITASEDDELPKGQDFFNKIILLFITIKHRILHSLGLIHKYSLPSVMANYENVFQKDNLFFLMLEDYEALNQCYGKYEKYPTFIKNSQYFNLTLFNLFINNFEQFKHEFVMYHF